MPINPRLTKLRVLGLEELERSKKLVHRWLLYGTSQDDHLGVDFDGYERQAGHTWIQAKFRGRGYVEATNSSVPFGGRRPTCHSMLVGETVDGYTALLLGTGRQPTMRFIGDDSSTEAITALFGYADFWPVMAEARKLGGAMGASAVLPEVRDGKMSLRALRPEHLFIEWTEDAVWVPELVIEQKKVTIEQFDKHGRIETVQMWRTRAWDATHSYAYKDIPVTAADANDAETTGDPRHDVELSEAPVEHHAGRCPLIWIQNTLDCDSPIGEPDCEAIYEQVEQLDRSMSMVMRGSRANNDPTLVVSDTVSGRNSWPKRAKGYGRGIELSEKGKAALLETQGRAIESSWLSITKLEDRARQRVGTVSPNPDNAGAYQSGVALQILHRTETSRAGERRNPLGVAICQLAQTVWQQCKNLGIRTYGSEGKGIELPPREIPRDPEAEGEDYEAEMEDHSLGEGGVVALAWPKLHEPIPDELRTMMDALAKAVAARIISLETATNYALKVMQSDVDPASERERIKKELEATVEGFDAAMMPDVGEGEEGVDPPVDGEPTKPTDGTDVQREALNGIQIKELGNSFARAGLDLAPETAEVVITEGFPAIAPERVKEGIANQIAFAKAQPPPTDPAAAATPPADVPEPREAEEKEPEDD